MRHIKIIIIMVLALSMSLHIVSCHKNNDLQSVYYADRVAQDPAYRIGKWYSPASADTIWFVNDTLAGWTGQGGNPYVFWKTYFQDVYHIAVIRPGVSWQPAGTIDTVISECGMTATGDTFGIYDHNGLNTILYQYVKKMN